MHCVPPAPHLSGAGGSAREYRAAGLCAHVHTSDLVHGREGLSSGDFLALTYLSQCQFQGNNSKFTGVSRVMLTEVSLRRGPREVSSCSLALGPWQGNKGSSERAALSSYLA